MNGFEEHIDKYLSGQISGEELVQFESRLKTDAAFKAAVDMQKLANQAIISGAQLNIKSQLQGIHIQHKKTKLLKTISIIGLLAITAVALVIVFNSSEKEQEQTANENSQTEIPNSNDTALIDESSDSLKNSTANNFEHQNEETKKLIIETLTDNKVKNPDSIVELYGPVENIILNLEKIVPDENTDSLKVALEKVIDTATFIVNDKTDPCLQVNKLSPHYTLTKPVFGGKNGSIRLKETNVDNVIFSNYSIDGGETYVSAYESNEVTIGKYQLIAKDENGCLTKSKSVELNYKESNYVIQPSMSKFWEIEIPDMDNMPLKLEIRNARTGALVYTQQFDYSERFTWNGTGQSGNPLSMGNYVYIFSTQDSGLITKGQVTIL